MPFGDAGDRDGHVSTLHLPIRWRRDSKGYKASVAAGDHPAEDHSSQAIQLAEDEVSVAMIAGGAVEMANQLLPWSYGNLSTAEMARLLCALQQSTDKKWPELLELFALISTILWTGGSLDQALSLLVFLDGTQVPDCDLALRISEPINKDEMPLSEWRVRVLTLPYRSETLPPADQARERVDFLCLPDPVGGSIAVQKFLTFLRDVARAELAQREAMMQNPLRIFSREAAWYKKQLQQLFDRQDAFGRITTTKISHLLFQAIVEHTGGDVVSAALITRTDHHLASVRRHYTTPEMCPLQRIYVDVARTLHEEFALEGYKQQGPEIVGLTRRGIAVGSPLCPTMRAVQEAVRQLKSEIREAPSLDSANHAGGETIRRHNLYTLYCIWSLGFAVGIRGVRTPYLHSSCVDQYTGLATITDKDSGSGYKSRLVWMPALVRKQMKSYEVYLSGMAEMCGLEAPTRKRPCYFLGDDLKIREVRPRTIAPFVRDYLPFPANVARHFVCTELKERGFPPEMIDVWMGHWWRGEEPWGLHSSFSFLEYRSELERVLPPFLAELGFETISLRFTVRAI